MVLEFDSFRNPTQDTREGFVMQTYEDKEGYYFMDRLEGLVPEYQEPYSHPDVPPSKLITQYSLHQENLSPAAVTTYVIEFTPVSDARSIRIGWPEQVEVTKSFWCRVQGKEHECEVQREWRAVVLGDVEVRGGVQVQIELIGMRNPVDNK